MIYLSSYHIVTVFVIISSPTISKFPHTWMPTYQSVEDVPDKCFIMTQPVAIQDAMSQRSHSLLKQLHTLSLIITPAIAQYLPQEECVKC